MNSHSQKYLILLENFSAKCTIVPSIIYKLDNDWSNGQKFHEYICTEPNSENSTYVGYLLYKSTYLIGWHWSIPSVLCQIQSPDFLQCYVKKLTWVLDFTKVHWLWTLTWIYHYAIIHFKYGNNSTNIKKSILVTM